MGKKHTKEEHRLQKYLEISMLVLSSLIMVQFEREEVREEKKREGGRRRDKEKR